MVRLNGRRCLLFVSIATVLLFALLWSASFSPSASSGSAEAAIFLCVLGAALNLPSVRLEHGRLSLSAIVGVAAATLLTSPQAALVGLGIGVASMARSWVVRAIHIAGATLYTTLAAAIARLLSPSLLAGAAHATAGAVAFLVLNIALAGLMLHFISGEPALSIWRRTATRTFLAAFGYFALAGALVATVLDGTPRGYLLAIVIAVLALALTDTVGGRRILTVLEAELSDAERHTILSRAVEGVAHNIRNNIAVVQGYLQELRQSELKADDQETVTMALTATNDVLSVLHTLSVGATPQARFDPDPVDLNEVAVFSTHAARQRARAKRVEVALRESPERVSVKADQSLLREVVVNLLNNAVDAVHVGGHVRIEVGTRQGGWPYLSVIDDGPGILDENRQRLFEPHFTTKKDGTGLGLYVSYGIVREHQGQILYEGSHGGAVFTVLLPPFGAEPPRPESRRPPASVERRTHPAPRHEPVSPNPPPR